MGRWFHRISAHAALWGLFSLGVVLLHGAIWEENYEFAQVLLGQISYPEAHPLYLHAHNLVSLQLYVSALHLWLGADPAWANGLRNALYILAKTLPFFYLGAWLGRRVLVGHLAALLALLAAGEGFTRAYPTLTWPMFAGNGVIGMGFALLAVVCLACGRYGAGFALAGAMPAIHLGQCPPLGLLCAVVFLHVLQKGTASERRHMYWGIAIGCAITGATLLTYWCFHVRYAPAPPYLSEVPPEIIWGRWLDNLGGHQVLGLGKDLIIMVWALWVLVACLWSEWRNPAGRLTYLVLLAYTAFLCLMVWGIMLVHARMGEQTPNLLLGWLPYRLPNHLPPLIAAVLVVRLYAAPGFGRVALLILLALSFVLGPEEAFVALSAAAIPWLGAGMKPRWAGIAWAVLALAGWWFVPYRILDTFYFSYALAFGMICYLLQFTRLRALTEWSGLSTLPAIAIAAALLLCVWLRPHLPKGEPDLVRADAFQVAVARLKSEGSIVPGEMICVPHLQRTLQGRLNHPVTTDFATLTWVPYHPEIGPAIHTLYRDLYGLNIAAEPGQPVESDWYRLWMGRSPEEWRSLGAKYGFRLVVTPLQLDLSLQLLVEGGLFKLYTIPES